MPEVLKISIDNLDLSDYPTPDEINNWLKSLNLSKNQWAEICRKNRSVLKIMEQPLKKTMEIVDNYLNPPDENCINPS